MIDSYLYKAAGVAKLLRQMGYSVERAQAVPGAARLIIDRPFDGLAEAQVDMAVTYSEGWGSVLFYGVTVMWKEA